MYILNLKPKQRDSNHNGWVRSWLVDCHYLRVGTVPCNGPSNSSFIVYAFKVELPVVGLLLKRLVTVPQQRVSALEDLHRDASVASQRHLVPGIKENTSNLVGGRIARLERARSVENVLLLIAGCTSSGALKNGSPRGIPHDKGVVARRVVAVKLCVDQFRMNRHPPLGATEEAAPVFVRQLPLIRANESAGCQYAAFGEVAQRAAVPRQTAAVSALSRGGFREIRVAAGQCAARVLVEHGGCG